MYPPPEPSSHASSTADQSAQVLLRAACERIGATFAGPAPVPPATGGPQTFGDWLDQAGTSDRWPPIEEILPSATWQTVRQHLRDLTDAVRASASEGVSADINATAVGQLQRLLKFGLIYALNAVDPNDNFRPQYDFSPAQKADILAALLDPPDASAAHGRLTGDILRDRQWTGSRVAGLKFFHARIADFLPPTGDQAVVGPPAGATSAAQLSIAGAAATASKPSILAQQTWVRFMIRYHRREGTIRGAVVNLFRPQTGASRPTLGRRTEFWALRDINLAVYPGQVLGLLGRNGAGKTTLLKTLAGILAPDRGRVEVRGRVGCLLSFGVGFNPNLSGRENIYLNGSVLGLSERDIDARLDEIVAFCELEEFLDAPVRTYSAGMRGRLGFSIAIHIDPDVLILDEVLTVGDDYFRAKAGSIVDRFRRSEKTVIIASHSMTLIREVCTHAAWLDRGEVRMLGAPADVTRAYVADCREQRERQGAPSAT